MRPEMDIWRFASFTGPCVLDKDTRSAMALSRRVSKHASTAAYCVGTVINILRIRITSAHFQNLPVLPDHLYPSAMPCSVHLQNFRECRSQQNRPLRVNAWCSEHCPHRCRRNKNCSSFPATRTSPSSCAS